MENLEKVWEISPYNTMAYGALVFILMSAVLYLGRQVKAKDDKIAELNDKMHDALDVVSEKLVEVKTFNLDLKGVQEKVLYILEDIKFRLNGKDN